MITDEMFELWDYMVEAEIATKDELILAFQLCGHTIETLNNVLFIRTGCRNLAQLKEEEED